MFISALTQVGIQGIPYVHYFKPISPLSSGKSGLGKKAFCTLLLSAAQDRVPSPPLGSLSKRKDFSMVMVLEHSREDSRP
jgi:hypothetical protein